MLTALLDVVQAMSTLTFNTPKFKDRTPGRREYDNATFSVSSPTKKGTVVIVDSGNANKVKVADVAITCSGDADWVGLPKLLAQNVRDIDTGYVEGYRKGINSDINLSDQVALIHLPGSILEIGQQNSTDKQAGWVGSATRGDRLYASCNTVTGAADGGIWNTSTFTNSASEACFSIPIGEARNSVSASTDVLKFEFMPQIVHGSLYSE